MIAFRQSDDQLKSPEPTPLFSGTAVESEANSWTAVNGWSVARVYTDVREEYNALTQDAALVDGCSLVRHTVRGYDAAAVLSRLTSAPVEDLGVGEIGRGLILDDQGYVVDHADITRLSGDLYLLTTSGPIQRRAQLAGRGLDAEIQNISRSIAVLSIIGPDSRAIASMAGFEVANDFLASQSTVRGIETCIRPLMIGSVEGVEIVFPSEEALTLWERVRRVRKVKPAGIDALSIAQIEAGVPTVGRDFMSADESTNDGKMKPKDIGLPHLAPLDRAWFNGRRQLKNSPFSDHYLFAFKADDDHVEVGATVCSGGNVIGKVKSSEFSPSQRCAVGFAVIENGNEPSSVKAEKGPQELSRLLTIEGESASRFLKEQNS